jgi:ABC-type Fe3+ transport system permease subunit
MEDSVQKQTDDYSPIQSEPTERNASGLARYAKPALIAGASIALVCLALLVILFVLDSFNATVYSVSGKDISDATEEAREIRDSYAGSRMFAIVGLVISGVVAVAASVAIFLNRTNEPQDEDDDGEDVGFEGLTGR